MENFQQIKLIKEVVVQTEDNEYLSRKISAPEVSSSIKTLVTLCWCLLENKKKTCWIDEGIT